MISFFLFYTVVIEFLHFCLIIWTYNSLQQLYLHGLYCISRYSISSGIVSPIFGHTICRQILYLQKAGDTIICWNCMSIEIEIQYFDISVCTRKPQKTIRMKQKLNEQTRLRGIEPIQLDTKIISYQFHAKSCKTSVSVCKLSKA